MRCSFLQKQKKKCVGIFLKIKMKIDEENAKKYNKNHNEDKKSSDSSDIGSDNHIINKNESNN